MGATCPVDGCDLRVDVFLKAQDGTIYGAHVRNVETFSTSIITPARNPFSLAPIELEEDAALVSLLCKFMHHRIQPDVSLLPFDVLCKLATAVEKYKIYNAMGVCKLKMEYSVKEHPYEVFQYASTTDNEALRERAVKFCLESHLECFVKSSELGITRLMDDAAAKTLSLPVSDVEKALRGKAHWRAILLTWVLQREDFRVRQQRLLMSPSAATQHKGGAQRCDDWHVYYNAVVMEFNRNPNGDLKEIIASNKRHIAQCPYCLKSAGVWERSVDAMRVTLAITSPFSAAYERYKESDSSDL